MSRSTASTRRLPAAALVLALFLTTVPALLLGTASPARAGATEFTGGTVSWGIKASWRRYIGQGSRAEDGATIDGWDGNTPTGFTFPIESGSFDPATNTTTLDLAGSVHFQAYYEFTSPGKYALDTKYSDLTLRLGPDVQELRGTHTGYTREDPGGELHEDVDVVLATFDLTGATTDFAADRTTWTDIPTAAGAGFSIYPEGAAIDPLSIDYPGPGGMPDLAERFDRPGLPVLTPGARWLSGSTGPTGTGRALIASPRGDLVYAVQVTSANTAQPAPHNVLLVQALDATTMTPVGTAYQHPLTSTGSTQRYLRTAIDPATDTVFLLTGRDGTGGNEVTARSVTYDRDSRTFTPRVVGSVVIAAGAAVSGLAWNAVDQELAFVGAAAASTTAANPPRLIRFARAGETWTTTDTAFALGATDTFPGGRVCSCNSVVSTAVSGPANLGVLGDGSYVLATGTASVTVDGVRSQAPAQHLEVAADGALAVRSILGTEAVTGSIGTYGRTLVASGPDGSVYLHGPGQDQKDYQRVDVRDGVAIAGAFVEGPDVQEPMGYSVLAGSMAYDVARGLLWATDPAFGGGSGLKLVDETGIVAGYDAPDFVSTGGEPTVVVGPSGSLYLPIRQSVDGALIYGFERFGFEGIAPAVTAHPQDETVDLAIDEASRTVTFETAVDAELGGDVQWQVRLPGTTRFANVEGATATTMSVPASPATDGRTYRAIVTNDAGRVASDGADLEVTYAPRVTTDPRDVRVTEGANALFTAEVIGNPAISTITWQRRVGGFWQEVEPDDDLVVDTADGVTSLRLTGTATDQSGTRFRVKATSTAGAGYSRAATLTVEPSVVVPPEGLRLDGVVLDWTGSEELQSAPPFGGNNYFSAGTSDGTQATYLADQGDVAVLQVGPDGSEAPATWATRGSHVGTDGRQLVRLSGGDARLAADGSATVSWTGAFSVNFYGGLVPFTVTDPVLTVAEDGTGTLVGDITGYSSSMDDPDTRTPMPPAPDVTISTFAGVDLDPAGTVTVTPEYDGVTLDVPAGHTAQVRTGAGWGSWPQEFVDVHFTTGLSSYWYSSGGAADPKKRPAPFEVDFVDATQVTEPDPDPDVDTGVEPPSSRVASTTVVSLDRTRAQYGRQVTATVTVSAPGAVPTGRVTLTTPAGPVTGQLVAGRVVVQVPRGPRPGPVLLSASYGGTPGIAPSESTARYQVTRAKPRIRLQLKKQSGHRTVAHVVVSVPGGMAPRGEVVVTSGRTVLVAKMLRAGHDGRLRIKLPPLDHGRHLLRATIAKTDLQVAAHSRYRTVVVS